jgi:peptide chain release factor 2
MESSDFWLDSDRATQTVEAANRLRAWVRPCNAAKRTLEELSEVVVEVDQLGDPEFTSQVRAECARLEKEIDALELKRMLSGPLDSSSCFLSINAGAGGTESCDWAQMLLRMYSRWAERRGWRVELVDEVEGEVAGIKSATVQISGAFAFGYAKAERGVHRLVRISPFDSGGRRHTSFASVDVVPEIDASIEVEISPDELRIDTFRSSGAGGQHVNTTDSAVRITHLPTGIVVSCQKERSQIKNRETAMKVLRSRIYEQKLAEQRAEIEGLGGEKKEIGWGSQIRSYVFAPYQLVKDNRTKVETGDVQSVMDGALDPFVEAYLKQMGDRA